MDQCLKVGMEPFLCSIPEREKGVGMFCALGLIRDENLTGLESNTLRVGRKSLRKHSLLSHMHNHLVCVCVCVCVLRVFSICG